MECFFFAPRPSILTVENVPVHEAEDDCAEEGEDARRADDQQRPAEGGVRLLGRDDPHIKTAA